MKMMRFLLVACALLCGVVTGNNQDVDNSGVSQFWADDYKIFEQIYGRTSDRQLYGVTLPPSISYGVDASNLMKNLKQATEKKEQLKITDFDSSPTATQLDLQKYANKYALLQKYTKVPQTEKEIKNPKAGYKFIGYNQFKPITKENDPETYNYFQHLEMLSKQQNIGFPQRGLSAYKTQNAFDAVNPENTDAYKSIQDILDAHEAKKKKRPTDDVKYINYPGRKNIRYINSNDISRYTKCSAGRCRKRAIPVRIRSRPVIRKIKVISE